jgi:GT2 family glycosyltransferase
VVAGLGADQYLRRLPSVLPPHLLFTGFVDDIAALIKASDVVIVPLTAGSGTRYKILESVACGRRVISTSLGAEGLVRSALGQALTIADDWSEFAQQTAHALSLPREVPLPQSFIEHYDWNHVFQALDSTLQPSHPTPRTPHPEVHIVILTWNQVELTVTCLESVFRLTYPTYGVTVVDNGSEDDTVTVVRSRFPEATVIENGGNLGFAAGCNIGMRHALDAGAAYVLLLNNDTVVPTDLLDILVARAEILPDAGILTPMLRYLDDPSKFWFAGSKRHWLTLEAVEFGPLGPRGSIQAAQQREVDYIFGTAMLVPARVLKEVGLFDEAFFLYYEDMDLCLRVQAAGYRLYYIPGVSVQHGISASTRASSPLRYYHKARASVIFFRKHSRIARRFAIVPYRVASAARTMIRLARKREWESARAYLRGLQDGLTVRAEA